MLARKHTIAHDALTVIDIVNKRFSARARCCRPDSMPPLLQRDDARDDIERPGAIDRTTLS